MGDIADGIIDEGLTQEREYSEAAQAILDDLDNTELVRLCKEIKGYKKLKFIKSVLEYYKFTGKLSDKQRWCLARFIVEHETPSY